jgi:hypothetical protein
MHEAIERWFVTGDDDAFDRLAGVLAPEFVIVVPGGSAVDRDALLAGLADAGGSRADDDPVFGIEIRHVEPRLTGDGYCLVTYEEWQSGDGDETGRVSSALFRPADGAPEGVEWVHLHETWLASPE